MYFWSTESLTLVIISSSVQIWRFDDDIAGLGRQGESSAHCRILLGAWICQLPHPPPGFLSAGQVTTDWVAMQATDIFTYNMTHCPGVENTATASVLLDTIVRYSQSLLWVSNPGNFSSDQHLLRWISIQYLWNLKTILYRGKNLKKLKMRKIKKMWYFCQISSNLKLITSQIVKFDFRIIKFSKFFQFQNFFIWKNHFVLFVQILHKKLVKIEEKSYFW